MAEKVTIQYISEHLPLPTQQRPYPILLTASMASNADLTSDPSITVKSLSYKFPDGSLGLQDINLSLPAGSRTLLIGGA